MATIDVLDATSGTVAIEKPLAPGTAAAAASKPVTLSTEDKALLATAGGGLTNTQLRATPVPVSGTVSISGGGDASAANQTTGNASLSSIDGKTPALGQALAAASTPVVLTAAQIVTLTPVAALTDTQLRATPVPVSGTVSITGGGDATAANQTTGNASLASIDGKTPALGQAVAGASVPVVLPAAQITTLTPPAAITGFATETTLAAQSAKLPASLGSKTSANSLSIAPASDAAFSLAAPKVSSGVIVSLQTNATGTTYNAFGSQACTALEIVNTHPTTAVDLEVRRGGSGNTIIVPNGSARMFVGITNASDLQVRRFDQSNTQVTFTADTIA